MSSNIRVNSITPSVGNNVAIGTAGGTITFNCDTISGIATFANDIDITQKLDVDGHTELDNVNISGVVTATSFVGPVTGNADTSSNLTGSPSISVTDLTASGNVSIAGTLTYEDVTNIDSVGVITARSGIHVTGSGGNGRVGIGTDNPTEKLHLYTDSSAEIKVESTSSTGISAITLKANGGQVNFGEHGGVDNRGQIQYSNSANTLNGAAADRMEFFTNNDISNAAITITSGNNIGIGTAVPAVSLDLASNTDALSLPTGTTAQRPSGTDAYIRKNSTNNALEFYNGTEWVEIITDYFPTGSTTLG